MNRWLGVLFLSVVVASCSADEAITLMQPVDPGGPPEPGQTAADTLSISGTYDVEWSIFAQQLDNPSDILDLTCPGTIIFAASDAEYDFGGSYLMLPEGDCAEGTTASGAVIDGHSRQDGGIDFGMEVPGSASNIFEHFVVGSGRQLNALNVLGCDVRTKDLLNHYVGSVLDDVLRSAASASINCPSPEGVATVQLQISAIGEKRP